MVKAGGRFKENLESLGAVPGAHSTARSSQPAFIHPQGADSARGVVRLLLPQDQGRRHQRSRSSRPLSEDQASLA